LREEKKNYRSELKREDILGRAINAGSRGESQGRQNRRENLRDAGEKEKTSTEELEGGPALCNLRERIAKRVYELKRRSPLKTTRCQEKWRIYFTQH